MTQILAWACCSKEYDCGASGYYKLHFWDRMGFGTLSFLVVSEVCTVSAKNNAHFLKIIRFLKFQPRRVPDDFRSVLKACS
jgi:hypothetical protein